MSDAVASTACQRNGAGRLLPNFRYGGMSFVSYFVAEPDSIHPACLTRLMKFLMRKGRSREDAEDLIQEALLHLHVYAMGNAVVNEEAFLRHAVHNLAIDQYRRDRFGVCQEVPIEDVDRENPLIVSGPTPDQILDSQQRLAKLTALLDAVNPRTREIYFVRLSGYTCAEIASDMGIAEITVKRHITRARMTVMSLTDRNGYTRSRRH